MIAKLRKKLTNLYTIVFSSFLFIFILMVSTGAIWNIYQERVNEIEILASQLAKEQRDVLNQHYKNPNSLPTELFIEENYDISGQVFYYLLDRQGKLVKADQPVPVLRDTVFNKVINWDPEKTTTFAKLSLPNGENAVIILTAQKIFSEEQNLLGTIYTGRDVTAYARVLVHIVAALFFAALVFSLLAALTGYFLAGKVVVPIEKAIKRQKQFAADASHELRTPLSVLQTSIEAIELDEENKFSAFSVQILKNVKDEFNRMKRLIRDLLTLARADAGDISSSKTVLFLNSVVEQTVRSLKIAAERKNIELASIVQEPLQITGDADRIYQLLYIL